MLTHAKLEKKRETRIDPRAVARPTKIRVRITALVLGGEFISMDSSLSGFNFVFIWYARANKKKKKIRRETNQRWPWEKISLGFK